MIILGVGILGLQYEGRLDKVEARSKGWFKLAPWGSSIGPG